MFSSTQICLHDSALYDGVGDNYLAIGVPWRGGYGHPISKLQKLYEVFSPCAAAAMYRTDAFRSAGGFDESYFCYVEDVDLGFRMRLNGERCIQVADAVVGHAGGGSASDGAFTRYYGVRNLVWTFVKNMPSPLFWPLLPVHLLTLCVLVAWAAFNGDASPTVRGIRDASAGLPDVWKERARIQSGRKTPVRAITVAMHWSPSTYIRRAPRL